MKNNIILLNILFSVFVFGQRKNTPYQNLSQHYLISFKNDSIVNFSEFPKHMSPTFSKNIKYKKEGDEIKIFLNGFYDFEKKKFDLPDKDFLFLKLENEILLNDEQKIIFVLFNSKKPYYITFLIDGKKYFRQMYHSNSYGFLGGNPKENPELDNELKIIEKNPKKYIFETFSGYEAYKKYGKKYLDGIIIINRK